MTSRGGDVGTTVVERWQVADGPTIGVRRWTSAAGARPIVLLHGLSASSAHYAELGPRLADLGWDVSALDFRGHGTSDRVPGTYSIAHYAADVAAYLASLAAPAVLVGHSLGAATAVYLGGSRPDLVRAVFAEDPPLYHGLPGVMAATPYPAVFAAIQAGMHAAQLAASTGDTDGARSTMEAFVATLPGGGGRRWVDTVSPGDATARVESFLGCDPEVWTPAIAGEALAGWDPERAIDVPLTILRADRAFGPALTPAEAERFGTANPSARIVEIAGAPHGIREHVASSERYHAELLAFLGGL